MKAAKQPPSAELVGEALVIIDMLILDSSGETWTPELRAMRRRMLEGAVAEYLRRFPTARSTGATYVMVTRLKDNEYDVLCLFCRTSLNTAPLGTRMNAAPFWRRIHEHTERCACEMLAGRMIPTGPRGERGERVTPVSKLRGNALVKAAKEAADYLGEPAPKIRRKRGSRTGVPSGRATELRALVTRARRAAAERKPG